MRFRVSVSFFSKEVIVMLGGSFSSLLFCLFELTIVNVVMVV